MKGNLFKAESKGLEEFLSRMDLIIIVIGVLIKKSEILFTTILLLISGLSTAIFPKRNWTLLITI